MILCREKTDQDRRVRVPKQERDKANAASPKAPGKVAVATKPEGSRAPARAAAKARAVLK